MLDRVVAVARAHGLADLPGDQPLERPRLQPHRVGAEVGQQVGRPREQEVAGEDRDRVVPAGVRRHRAAAHGRLVHDVVVVQRGEVGQLDHDGRRDDLGPRRVAEVRGQQADQRAEPLAPGVDQVGRRAGDEVVVGRGRRRAARPRPRRGRARTAASSTGSAKAMPDERRRSRGARCTRQFRGLRREVEDGLRARCRARR